MPQPCYVWALMARCGIHMKVLIVEDESLIALCLADELTESGHSVVGPAPTAAAALQLARKHKPTLALIDLDMGWSEDAGELARILKDDLNVDCLFLTCAPDLAEEYANTALGVIAKPFNFVDIPAALDEAAAFMAGRNPPPSSLPSALRLFA